MKWLLVLSLFLIPVILAQPFGPPIYIGNPETGECRYYFAGDEKHFNPRDESYSDDIGDTTDFESEEQACKTYKCFLGKGKWDLGNNVCVCADGSQKIDKEDCTSAFDNKEDTENEGNKITSRIIDVGLDTFNPERILVIFIVLLLIAYFVYSKRTISKMRKVIKK